MKKSVISVLLLVALVCTMLFTGCKSSTDKSADTTADSKSTQDQLINDKGKNSGNSTNGNGGSNTPDEDDSTESIKTEPSEGLEFERPTLVSIGGAPSYYVAGIGSCTDEDIVIPSTYEGAPVTRIGDGAFSNCTNIKRVIIP